jgi:hypothetical protein
MYEDIFETIVLGSNTIFLDIPEKDYFLSYEDLSMASAEEITENYFKTKGKEGVPTVKNIEHDTTTHMVKISIDVIFDRPSNFEAFKIPDSLNWRRR